jgi:glycosyltransferase involved in cell wall biosynthesis
VRVAVVGNGRSVHALTRAAAVAARGHEVRLVTLGDVLPGAAVEVRTRPLPRTPLQAVTATRGFLDDIATFAPDLLHLHYAGGRLGTLATLSSVRPLVVTVMGGDVLPEQHRGGLSALERRATRRILEQASLVLVKSDALRPAVARAAPAATARVETVRWGVDPAVFHRDATAAAAWRERLRVHAADRLVLSPRVLAPLYNVHLIVEALPHVLRSIPGALLLVSEYGADPAYARNLRSRAESLGVAARLRFIGQVAHADMPGLYSACDAVVSVPASDGLPQSLFEALACEAPVVLGRLPAYAEVVQDGAHVVLADFNPAAIADAVVRLLADDAFRRALAVDGRDRILAMASLPLEAERVERFYADALRAPVPPAPPFLRMADAASLFFR